MIRLNNGWWWPYDLDFTEHSVTMHGLPQALDGATAVHITDLHAGFGHTEQVFDALVHKVAEIKPDYLFFTGDFVDDSGPHNAYVIEKLLCRFDAKYGKFGCLGNHDHRRGFQHTLHAVERGGVRVLRNENLVTPEGLWIAGVDDLREGRPDLRHAVEGLPQDRTSVLLSHNPRAIEKVGLFDLFVLSGHTHGGQFNLPIITPRLVCLLHLHCRQVAGWYSNGRSRLYVSRGVGVTGHPFRYRCPAEVAVFTLIAAPMDTAPSVTERVLAGCD